MKTFFKITTRQKPNGGKWVTGYIKMTPSSAGHHDVRYNWDKEFDSKDEADKYATGFCLKEGWIPVIKK